VRHDESQTGGNADADAYANEKAKPALGRFNVIERPTSYLNCHRISGFVLKSNHVSVPIY